MYAESTSGAGRRLGTCRELVFAETVLAPPLLCPELTLHLITDRCRLWRAGERELEALGLPDPYWAFAWPGGQGLARHLLDHPQLVTNRTVLDFGTGSGLVAIAAARAGASHVSATEIDPHAIAAAVLNAEHNHIDRGRLEVQLADVVGSDGGWDVVLAGDMSYEAELTARLLPWLRALAGRGALVLLGDPGRGHLARAEGIETLAAYEAPADVDVGGRHFVRTTIHRVWAHAAFSNCA